MTTQNTQLVQAGFKTHKSILNLPDLRFLNSPWIRWTVGLIEPGFAFPTAMFLTSIAAVGAAFNYHKRAENKRLFWTLSAATAVGAGITALTFLDYVASSKRYR